MRWNRDVVMKGCTVVAFFGEVNRDLSTDATTAAYDEADFLFGRVERHDCLTGARSDDVKV